MAQRCHNAILLFGMEWEMNEESFFCVLVRVHAFLSFLLYVIFSTHKHTRVQAYKIDSSKGRHDKDTNIYI